MILDEKGKLFGKISIVDILFLIVIVVGIAGAFVVFDKVKHNQVLTENKALVNVSESMDTLEIKLLLKEIRKMSLDAIKPGDDVFEMDTDKYLGKISRVEPQPAKALLTDLNGKMKYAEVPEKYDVYIYVETPGKQTETGFYTANNQHLVYGSQLGIKSTVVQTVPVIEDIQVTKRAENGEGGQ